MTKNNVFKLHMAKFRFASRGEIHLSKCRYLSCKYPIWASYVTVEINSPSQSIHPLILKQATKIVPSQHLMLFIQSNVNLGANPVLPNQFLLSQP